MTVLASAPYQSEDGKRLETIVDLGPYNGVVGTMWSIVREEGAAPDRGVVGGAIRPVKKGKKDAKGQGVEGLWRGWRVGMWGLVGMWGARAMGGSGANGGEF